MRVILLNEQYFRVPKNIHISKTNLVTVTTLSGTVLIEDDDYRTEDNGKETTTIQYGDGENAYTITIANSR